MLVLNLPWVGRNPYRFGLLVYVVFGIVMLPFAFIPSEGHIATAAVEDGLLQVGVGILFFLVSLAVRRRLRRVTRGWEVCQHFVYQADCLLMHGALQMPAKLAIADCSIMIKPSFGPALTVPLKLFAGVEPARWFNGQYLFGGARGFLLPILEGRRLGIAVPDADVFALQLHSADTAA